MGPGAPMRYLPTTGAQRAAMLEAIGVGELEGIPAKARLGRALALPAALAEGEVVGHPPNRVPTADGWGMLGCDGHRPRR